MGPLGPLGPFGFRDRIRALGLGGPLWRAFLEVLLGVRFLQLFFFGWGPGGGFILRFYMGLSFRVPRNKDPLFGSIRS